MTAPHETDEFRNSCEYTVTVTCRVAGGARPRTALSRARRIAERIVDHAARAADVVEVAATGGLSDDGLVQVSSPVRFSRANTGTGTRRTPDRLERYRDPEFDRALQSLADANAASRRRDADRDRRRAVACHSLDQSGLGEPQRCLCVYCRPAEHEQSRTSGQAFGADPPMTYRCVCGAPVSAVGARCERHRHVALVALDDDPPAVRRLVDTTRPPLPGPRLPGPDDGPELPGH